MGKRILVVLLGHLHGPASRQGLFEDIYREAANNRAVRLP